MALTRKEHALILFMLTKLRQQDKLILQLLKSREIVDQGDAEAFEAVLTSDDQANEELYQETLAIYKMTAKTLGIRTGL